MSRNVAMSFFVTIESQNKTKYIPSVFLNVTKVVTTNNNCTLHLRRNHQPLQNSTTDCNRRSKRALLIDIFPSNGKFRCLYTQTHIGIPTLVCRLTENMHFTKGELILLLECSLILQIIVRCDKVQKRKRITTLTQNNLKNVKTPTCS